MGERTRELLVLIVGDVLCFVLAIWLTLVVRYLGLPDSELLWAHLEPWVLLTAIWLFIFYSAGLYDKHTTFLKSLLLSRIINTQIVNILIAALVFMIVPFGIAPKTNLVIYLAISIVLVALWRLWLFNQFTPKSHQRAILLASGPEAIELVDEINNNDRYDYTFVRIIDDTAAGKTPDFESKLVQLIESEHISIIVANPRSEYIEAVLPALFDLAFLKFQFTFLDFFKVYEDTFDRVPLSALRYDWFIAHVSQSKSLVYDFVKRTLDIALSLVLGLLLLLLVPFIWVAKKIEGKGDALFMTQDRIGQYNQPMQVLKLQTMTQNDAASATWTTEDAKKGNQITKVGAFLRKTSLDEYPQVWNVLKGEMSLIGPRNDIAGLGARLAEEIPYYNIRNFVKPGISGWAQTNQHYMGDNISPQSLEESKLRLAYDLYYVKNRSLWLDLAIVIKTFKTLISRFGINFRLPR
jgi:lipopolysaccharide/colanic/teichoic acid biosynthesis glycosyltransferase